FGMLLGGQSPWAALQAWEDWAFHLMLSRGKQIELWELALEAASSLHRAPLEGEVQNGSLGSSSPDRRFRDPGWKRPPFSLLAQAQLAAEAQWRAATKDVPGMGRHHAKRVDFLGSFMLNALAPVNFAWTNPTVLEDGWRQFRRRRLSAGRGSHAARARGKAERARTVQDRREHCGHRGQGGVP